MKLVLKNIDGIDYTYCNHYGGSWLLKDVNAKDYIILKKDKSYKKVKDKKKKEEWFKEIKDLKDKE